MVVCISSGNFGIFGAGGNTGNSIFILGINDGISGKSGGDGITGIAGKFKDKSSFSNCIIKIFIILTHAETHSTFTAIVGGLGKFGKLGNGTEVGTKSNLGNFISVAIFI
jgi:hypothetical protein